MKFANWLSVAALLMTCVASAETIVTYPSGTTLENITIAPDGNLFATAINTGTVYKVSPAGASAVFGQAPGSTLGISRDLDGALVAAGGSNFYRFSSTGISSIVASVAGAQNLNGVALLSAGNFLVADSRAGTIWRVNVNTGASQAWLTDPALAIAPGSTRAVGVNGIKVFAGAVYVSNTSSSTVYRIPILAGGTAGLPAVYATNLQLDDFAFASDGTLFGATQFGSSVVRLATDGTRTTIATAADGLLGDAALAFGRTPADAEDIYVVNNGGAFLNLPGGPQPASIVRLAVGITGAVPELQAIPEPATFALAAVALIILAAWSRMRRLVTSL